jgi:CRP-like cAMP-binding protein
MADYHYMQAGEIIKILTMFRQDFSRLALFQGLSGEQLSQLEPLLALYHFRQNHVIFEQGHSAEHLFILQIGEVEVRYKPYDGPTLMVARIRLGGVFGWSAALRRSFYTSSAVAVQECYAYRISGLQLQQLCKRFPETGVVVLERLADVIAERLRSTHTQVVQVLSQGMEIDR